MVGDNVMLLSVFIPTTEKWDPSRIDEPHTRYFDNFEFIIPKFVWNEKHPDGILPDDIVDDIPEPQANGGKRRRTSRRRTNKRRRTNRKR